MFSRVTTALLRSVFGLVAMTLLATALLVGCGGGVAHESAFRWSDRFAAWSPNSRLILFSSDRPRHKQWDLYVMNSDGGHLQRLTDDKLNEAHGHPGFVDNRHIAFSAYGKRDVIPVNRTTNTAQLNSRARRVGTQHLAPNRSRAGSSPNGLWVAFARHRRRGPRDWYGDTAVNVYLMRRDGSDVNRVATVGPSTTFSPTWSPNSRAFAFEASPNGGPSVISQGTTLSEIWDVPVSSAKAIQVSDDPGSNSPVWSPNGSEIAFIINPGPDYSGLALTKPDGTDQHTVGTGSGLDVSTINWVVGGRKLFLGTGTGEYLVNSDGSDLRRLLSAPNADTFLSPDRTKAVIEEQGGPLIDWGCCFQNPRDSRIDVVDFNSGQLRSITQSSSR
jgi:Tol biopolymer transport system component